MYVKLLTSMFYADLQLQANICEFIEVQVAVNL